MRTMQFYFLACATCLFSLQSVEVEGANHFLHMIEHVEQCFLDPWKDLYPAEDGVANVVACNLVRRASIEA